MKTLTIFTFLVASLVIGCGNNRNPVNVQKNTSVEQLSPAENALDLTNIVFATVAAKAVASEETLDLSISSDIVNGEVVLSLVAEEGALVSGDIIRISLEDPTTGETTWGQLQVPGGLNPIVSTDIELTGFPQSEEIVIIVRVERDGDVISESRTDDSGDAPQLSLSNVTFTEDNDVVDEAPSDDSGDDTEEGSGEEDLNETDEESVSDDSESDTVTVENVTVASSVLTITFSETVDIKSRRAVLEGITLIDEHDEHLEISDIHEVDGDLVISTENDIPIGDYVLFYYGEPGIEFSESSLEDSEGVVTLSFNLTVEGGETEVVADTSGDETGTQSQTLSETETVESSTDSVNDDIIVNAWVNGDELTLVFDDDIEIDSRFKAIQALSLISHRGSGRSIEIDDIDIVDGNLTVLVSRNFREGQYTLTYDGNPGLEYDRDDLSLTVFNFDVEENRDEDLVVAGMEGPAVEEHSPSDSDETEEETVSEEDAEESSDDSEATEEEETDEDKGATFWTSMVVGVLTEDGSTVTELLDAEGVLMTDWARGCIEGRDWEVGGEDEIDLYIVTEGDLGLSGTYTIGQLRAAVSDAGYRMVPVETAVLARYFYKGQPANEHLLFVSEYLGFQGKDHMLVVTGQAYGKPAGDWLAAHRFSLGNDAVVFPGHQFVVTK